MTILRKRRGGVTVPLSLNPSSHSPAACSTPDSSPAFDAPVRQALDTCRLLSTRLLQERLEAGLYGLYPRYKLYSAPLAALLGLVASAAVLGGIHRDRGSPSDKR